jgi:ubiquitin carboxyl-terminal hydrolase 1
MLSYVLDLLKWPQLSGTGLLNLGNTCFLNAVLQSLTTEKFESYLSGLVEAAPEEKMVFCRAMLQCVQSLSGKQRANNSIITGAFNPTRILSLIREHYRSRYSNQDQQDAEELLLAILDIVDNESESRSNDIAFNLDQLENTADRIFDYGLFTNAFVSHSIPVERLYRRAAKSPFEGTYTSVMKCHSCHSIRPYRHQKFTNIKVTIPDPQAVLRKKSQQQRLQNSSEDLVVYHQNCVRLEDCLDAYSRAEEIGDYKCQRCSFLSSPALSASKNSKRYYYKGKSDTYMNEELMDTVKAQSERRQSISKQMMISSPPSDILIIHLNRSDFSAINGQAIKNNTSVLISEQLDISKHVLFVRGDGGNKYELKAVIRHEGNAYFGHYTSYCKKNTGWMYFSDEKAMSVSWQKVYNMGKSAYLLIYER